MKKSEVVYIILLVALDQVTKFAIESKLALFESIEIIKGFFSITHVTNTGAGWSILEGQMYFFYFMTAVALVVMTYFLIKADKHDYLLRLALVLIIAGALGNFIDRLMFQHVRDFLDFNIFGYDFPVFNVADSELTIGVALMAFDILFVKEQNHGKV